MLHGRDRCSTVALPVLKGEFRDLALLVEVDVVFAPGEAHLKNLLNSPQVLLRGFAFFSQVFIVAGRLKEHARVKCKMPRRCCCRWQSCQNVGVEDLVEGVRHATVQKRS